MRRVENWFSSAENMIERSRNWKRNSIKNSIRQRENSDEKPPKKTNVTKLMKSAASWRPRYEAYAKFSEKVDEENRRFDEKRDKIIDKIRKK